MQKHLKSVKNESGHLGGCRFHAYILIEPLRSRSAWSRGLNRRSVGETRLIPTVLMRVKRGVPCWRGVPWRGVPWRGVPCAGCRARGAVAGFRRGTQKFKMDIQWLPIVLRCCSDVVELDLSFKTRIRLSHNSSGRPSCGPDTVLEKNLLFFDQFSVFFGRRGRPLEPDTQTGK